MLIDVIKTSVTLEDFEKRFLSAKENFELDTSKVSEAYFTSSKVHALHSKLTKNRGQHSTNF